MKIVDSYLEMKAIKTICSSTNEIGRAKLLTKTGDDYFYDDTAKAIYHRIKGLAEADGKIPTWTELLTDPGLPEDVREEIGNSQNTRLKPTRAGSRIKRMYEQLNSWRQLRIFYFLCRNGINTLDKSKAFPDVESLLATATETLLDARTEGKNIKQLLVGQDDNSDEMLESLLSDERPDVVPTGFKAFDEKNRGIMPGSLVLLAASTGGGKSALSMCMAMNMASLAGKKVCFIPLEMSKQHMMGRMVSRVSQISVEKFLLTRLTGNEKAKARKDWREFRTRIRKLGGNIRIFEPDSDYNMDQLLTLIAPYNDDVVFVDYVGLVGGVDGDDFWRKLGASARYAKRWAEANNKIVVLLAQLSEEGVVRYSRALREHADIAWNWVMTPEAKESNIISIIQSKARTVGSPEDFMLKFDFAHMTFEDLTEEDLESMDSPESSDSDDLDETPQEKRRKNQRRRIARKTKGNARTARRKREADKYLEDVA